MLKHLIFLSIIIVLITLGNFLSAKPKLYAYVASLSSKGAMISKIDVAELRVTKQEPFLEKGTFGAPVSIVISPDGKEIYIGMEKSVYTIYGIEAKTLKTIRKYFSGKIKNSYDPFYTARLAISPSGNKLYARGMDTLARWVVIDVRNFDELKRDSIIEEFVYDKSIKTVSKYLICCLIGGGIKVIDTERDEVVASLSSSKTKKGLNLLNVDGEIIKIYVYLTNPSVVYLRDSHKQYFRYSHYDKKAGKITSAVIKVLDTSTGKVVDSIPFPKELEPDPSAFSGKELAKIDPIFKQFANQEDEFPVVMGYGEISVSPDGKYIFWPVGTNMQNSQISYIIVIDTKTKKVVKRIPVGAGGITNVVFGYE